MKTRSQRALATVFIMGCLVLSYQNCGNVKIGTSGSTEVLPEEIPQEIESSDKVVLDEYQPPNEDAQSYTAGTNTPWAQAAEDPNTIFVPGTLNRYLRPNGRGCVVFNKSDMPEWTPDLNHTAITGNVPLVMHGQHDTVSIRFTDRELSMLKHGPNDYRGQIFAYEQSKPMVISITSSPCEFFKESAVISNPDICQRDQGDIHFIRGDSDPSVLDRIRSVSTLYMRPCVLERRSEYYVNFRFIRVSDIGKSNPPSTCQTQWCPHFPLLRGVDCARNYGSGIVPEACQPGY